MTGYSGPMSWRCHGNQDHEAWLATAGDDGLLPAAAAGRGRRYLARRWTGGGRCHGGANHPGRSDRTGRRRVLRRCLAAGGDRRGGGDRAQLDTPGGLSESMRQIISRMLASPVPVLVYVAPGGARAASAGTYILYAGQIAAMAPATHLGAATPVSLGGATPMPLPVPKADESPAKAGSNAPAKEDQADEGAESHKVLNDAIAYIRSLAQLRGRNAAWAEQAVRGAATLTASEAAKEHVIDFVADDMTDLLAKSDGRKVQVAHRSVTLQLKDATVRDYAPGPRTRFLAIITNPTIAYLLLLGGILGLGLEATHPGAMLPGIVGAICLLVGLYALQLLPVNYAGLALMALGIGLLVAEAVNPTVGALGVGGVVSFVIGSVMLMKTGVPGYAG